MTDMERNAFGIQIVGINESSWNRSCEQELENEDTLLYSG